MTPGPDEFTNCGAAVAGQLVLLLTAGGRSCPACSLPRGAPGRVAVRETSGLRRREKPADEPGVGRGAVEACGSFRTRQGRPAGSVPVRD